MNDWWRGSVTYQIYPRSFQDSNGDGVGDLPGITSRLDHVAGLGVDAIWLSPFFTSPMKDMGYDVSDYCNVDPVFGTLDDFDALIARAHGLGLKVIIDQVISHSSDQHPAFAEARKSGKNPRSDWYVWADPKPDGSPPNNWLAIFGGSAWTWEPRRQQYYFHNFLTSQPDFNFHNPEVQDYHLDNMRFWLDRGVDGFRLDTVNFYFHDQRLPDDPADFRRKTKPEFNPYEMQYHLFSKNQPENLVFLQRMRSLLDEYEGRAMVGEVGESHHAIELMGTYTTGNRLHMAYSFEMLGDTFTAQHFRQKIEDFFAGAPGGWPCWAFSNHDVMRHAQRWLPHAGNTDALAKQACAMLLSFEGSICIYQGEELGQTDTQLEYSELTDPLGINFWPETKGRDGCRTPMVWDSQERNAGFSSGKPWLPVKPEQISRSASLQNSDPNSVLAFYRSALGIRKAYPDLVVAKASFIPTPEPLLAFTRGKIVCIYNLSAEPHVFPLTGATEVLLSHAARIQEGELKMEANACAWLQVTTES